MGQEGRDDEMDSLMDNPDLDSAKIVEQVMGKKPEGTDTSPATPPPVTPPAGTPPVTTPQNKDVPNPETIRTAMLNEMFGEQFKTVEDVKKANIPAALQELATLRQKNQELDTQLKVKPKHHYANDDIAKMDEFVRATGIKDAGIFNKINAADVANMEPMDALVLQHIIDNPSLAGKEPQVRRYFEMKYGVDSSKIDPKKVESGDLTQEELDQNKLQYDTNIIGVISDAAKVKASLQGLKDKIKVPESLGEIPDGKAKWTPEVETKQKTAWTTVSNSMLEQFAKIPLSIKNKDGAPVPVANFALPEKAKTELLSNALAYVVGNQMEVNEKNVKAVAESMYSDIWLTYKDDILHTLFERARTMTEKEYLETYHNPSKKNNDQPERTGGLKTEEDIQNDAFNLELNRR